MSRLFRRAGARCKLALSPALAAFACACAWAQPALPTPGFTWGEIRFPASAQPEDRDNAVLEGAVEQGVDFQRLSEKTHLNLFGKLDYTLDTQRFDYNNKLKLGAGVKLVRRLSSSSSLGIGAKYEVDRRFVMDRALGGHQLFMNWYGSWRLPRRCCGGSETTWPLAMPGVSWGEVRYPGSQVAAESHDLILEGKVEQGIDWADIAGWGVLNTYIELDYLADSKRYDWNNAIKMGLGAKLKTQIGKNLLQVGAKFVQDRRRVTDRTDETFLIFVNWSSGWGHNAVSRDVPNK